MSTENEVFRKIKELSTRKLHPRALINTQELAAELGTHRDSLMLSLNQLKSLRLINFNEAQAISVRLTLLGSVVNRDK